MLVNPSYDVWANVSIVKSPCKIPIVPDRIIPINSTMKTFTPVIAVASTTMYGITSIRLNG